MNIFIAVFSVLIFIACVIWLIIQLFRKKSREPALIGIIASFVLFMICVALTSSGESAPDVPAEPAYTPESVQLSSGEIESQSQIEEIDNFVNESQPEEITIDDLVSQIDAEIGGGFDGHTISCDGSTITMDAWKENFTRIVNLTQEGTVTPDKNGWEFLKSNTKESIISIIENTKTSQEDVNIIFNVLDGDDKSRVLLTFENSEVTYDILSDPEGKHAENKSTGITRHVESNNTVVKTKGDPTVGEQNALESAINYVTILPFSQDGLIKQLKYEGYSEEEAIYGASKCGADWNEEAVEAAANYLSIMSFSKDELIKQLEHDGFTHGQAVHGASQNGY